MAELLGTFALVLFGCGTAVLAGWNVGYLGIAFAFGVAVLGTIYVPHYAKKDTSPRTRRKAQKAGPIEEPEAKEGSGEMDQE
ncbi:MAG: hypothetical protein L0Z54_01995 [Thermoplasmata archaeon]|nr:hypothetical protein [Thermoplasmata archaeon]